MLLGAAPARPSRRPQAVVRRPLRVTTWLAPGLPVALFAALTRLLGDRLLTGAVLTVDGTRSGPAPGRPDPFAADAADLGFCCAPAYVWMADRAVPSVRLVPAAPVFDDPRADGEPVYFSDVVVRADHPAGDLGDLADGTWAYNDPCSWSGYLAVRRALAAVGGQPTYVPSGGHRQSLRLLCANRVDAAAVDANVLRLVLRGRPELRRRLRTLATFGPHPVQPVVARAGAGASFAQDVSTALLEIGRDAQPPPALRAAGVLGFAPVCDADYDTERAALASDLAAATISSSPSMTVSAAGPSGT